MENQEKLAEELLAKYPEKKIPCIAARAWAEENNVDLGEVGPICDTVGIKVIQCELGCF